MIFFFKQKTSYEMRISDWSSDVCSSDLILLAEDDDVMREYLARALTTAGYHVTAVDRGTAAVPYIDSGIFDLLLSDIVMPEMDGIELAQHTAKRSEERRVGKECVSKCRSRWSPYH